MLESLPLSEHRPYVVGPGWRVGSVTASRCSSSSSGCSWYCAYIPLCGAAHAFSSQCAALGKIGADPEGDTVKIKTVPRYR